jgi:hypothetical protein
MKKLFLFIYLVGIAGYFGYSQISLSLSDSTGPLANNATIYKYGTPLDDEILAYVFVKNNSADAIPVVVKKVVIDTVPGSINMFCWGLCFGSNVYISPNPISVAAGVTDSSNFSGHYVPNLHSGVSKLRYVFFSRSNPLDSVCVNVVYSAFPVGMEARVEKAVISNAYPNPANSSTTITYSLPGAASGSVMIRNLLGTTVKEITLEANSGKLSLSTGDLPEGVYFYSLIVNGKTDASKKLIIRH